MGQHVGQKPEISYNQAMPLPSDIEFSKLCKQLRTKGKYTQQEIADHLGVLLQVYQRWEYGKRNPNGKYAARIFALRDQLFKKN